MATRYGYRIFQLSQAQILILGVLTGYVGFVFWLGLRWIPLLSGAVIVAGAIATWFVQIKHQKIKHSVLITSENLLKAEVFLSQLNRLGEQIPQDARSLWQSVQQQAEAIQQTAVRISQKEATFIPDLLETLHTVLDLVDQLAQALQGIQQVQMPRYQALAQQQLNTSKVRLRQTQNQLQELCDQIVLENLKQHSLMTTSVISTRLQMLIEENEKGILGE
jgi:hypothetical protein